MSPPTGRERPTEPSVYVPTIRGRVLVRIVMVAAATPTTAGIRPLRVSGKINGSDRHRCRTCPPGRKPRGDHHHVYCPVAPPVDSEHQVIEVDPVQPLLIVSPAANGIID